MKESRAPRNCLASIGSTAVYFGGTGRFKGMKGGSTLDCILLGDRFICEVDGTIELP